MEIAEVQLYQFLLLALVGREWSILHPSHITPGEEHLASIEVEVE